MSIIFAVKTGVFFHSELIIGAVAILLLYKSNSFGWQLFLSALFESFSCLWFGFYFSSYGFYLSSYGFICCLNTFCDHFMQVCLVFFADRSYVSCGLALFGNFCCRLSLEPRCLTEVSRSGWLTIQVCTFRIIGAVVILLL